MAASNVENFLQRTRAAKKVMVLDLGFLGDTVHLLPALWMVRQAYPQAELHVTVSTHITSLMDCVPWVNRVWGYMRYPRHATLKENWQMVSRLRREKFDVVINLNGSDRSSWLTFLSGARERLGRVPDDGGPPFWRRMFTAHVECPPTQEPVYLQKCRCLAKAGFPFAPPEFHVEIAAENLRAAEITRIRPRNLFSHQPVHDRRLQGTAAGAAGGIHRRARGKFPRKKAGVVLRADGTRAEKNGGTARVAAAKTVARFRRQSEPDANRRRHQTQRAAFLRRHRHAAPRGDDADAGRRVVLAEPRPARMGADG